MQLDNYDSIIIHSCTVLASSVIDFGVLAVQLLPFNVDERPRASLRTICAPKTHHYPVMCYVDDCGGIDDANPSVHPSYTTSSFGSLHMIKLLVVAQDD